MQKYHKDFVALDLRPLRYNITYKSYFNSNGNTTPTNNQSNINPHRPSVYDEVWLLLPIHPQGTIEVPASPHITGAGGAKRDRHPGGVKARGSGRIAKKKMDAATI